MIGLLFSAPTILAAEEGGESASTSGPEVFGIGAVVLLVAVVAVLAWMAYLYVNSRKSRSASPEETPQNLQPYLSDDELENRRTTRVLRAALFGAALLAILLPWYALNEPDRQAEAAEELAHLDVEEGEHWYTFFSCVNCHGPDLGGGGAATTEARSGVSTVWAVPSLNDIFYRYSDDEIRTWIVFGRSGTPMPANGLAGGGAMTEQEVDQVMAYIADNQISQQEALAKRNPLAKGAVDRIAAGDATTQTFIDVQNAQIDDVKAAGGKLEVIGSFPDDIADLFSANGTCTVQSAALVDATCGSPGQDGDRDGITDVVEPTLTEYAAAALTAAPVLQADGTYSTNPAYDVSFDPAERFTNRLADGTAVPDLKVADNLLETLETTVLVLTVTDERQEEFLADLQTGLDFLEVSQQLGLWAADYAAVAERIMAAQMQDRLLARAAGESDLPDLVPVDAARAERAVGLFNGYCARCHTGGYSAGTPFETGHGTGAWGPSLVGGKSRLQFPDIADQIDFVVDGSEFGVAYGINGLGSGRMPGFGRVLTEEDVESIVLYERSLP